MNNTIRCAFYGSLRRPMYNYERFIQAYGKESILYKKTIILQGYELYDLGPYPGIKNAESSKTIVVDLFDVGKEVYDRIYSMETGANFYEDDVMIDNISYKIFPYLGKTYEYNLIESGDWLKKELNNYKTETNGTH